jgi:hypothetical protein
MCGSLHLQEQTQFHRPRIVGSAKTLDESNDSAHVAAAANTQSWREIRKHEHSCRIAADGFVTPRRWKKILRGSAPVRQR